MNWHVIIFILYFIFGAIAGIIFDLNWLTGQYWFFWAGAGLSANASYCYFTNKKMYFPSAQFVLPPGEKYATSRAFSGYLGVVAAVVCWMVWYQYYFGAFSGN